MAAEELRDVLTLAKRKAQEAEENTKAVEHGSKDDDRGGKRGSRDDGGGRKRMMERRG